MEKMDEVELVQRAKEDPEAFGILYERYVDRIYSYIYHRTGNRRDAEDLTAKTFYKALANIGHYENRGLPFLVWLYRIAHNLVANFLRDESRRKGKTIPLDKLAFALVNQRGADPAALAEANEEREALLEAIKQLPPYYQEVLILKHVEGMSNVEIGQIMGGRSESAVKSLYHRTLIALREELSKG